MTIEELAGTLVREKNENIDAAEEFQYRDEDRDDARE
jgi:hypothetical protein